MAGDLSEIELKKILIEEMESNKSIHRSDEQRNLYKALIDAYESDKIILDTYGDTVTLKRRRDDADKESTSAPKEKVTKTTGKSTQGSKSHQKTASESAPAEEPMQTTQDLEEPSHQEFEIGDADDQPIAKASHHPECDLAKQADSRSSFNELMDTHVDFSAFLMNRLKVDTFTPELLAGPTYELMKGSCKSLMELEFFLEEVYKATTDQLDWNNPEGQQYPHNLLKPLPLIPNFQGRLVIPFDHFINNDLEYLRGGASSRKVKYRSAMTNMLSGESLIGGANVNSSTDLQSTGSLLKMSTQNVESSLSPNFRLSNGTITSIWIGSRIVIQRRMEDLQLAVESYQKKLNLTKPDTYRADLKRKEAYSTYSNPRGFIYQNKDKQKRLMRIDELHKFSDGTLSDVQTALDDRLKAKDKADHAKSGEVHWWENIRGRLQDATTDHMIYHMISLSYKGHMSSLNKSFDVHEKEKTPRYCLRWILTCRAFKTVGLRWVLTRKTFTSSITQVECEPPDGSNKDITNPYECDQTLNVSAGDSLTKTSLHFIKIVFKCTQMIKRTAMVSIDNTSSPAPQRKESSGPGLYVMTPATPSTGLASNLVSKKPCIPPNKDDWDRLFQPMFDEYFNPPTIVVSPVQEAAALRAKVLADSPVSIFISQDASSTSIPSSQAQEHSLIISQGFKESPKTPTFPDDLLNESPQDSPSQGSSSNVIQIHTPFEHLDIWTKDHPIENVTDDHSRSVSIRKQLETDAMWCYFDAFFSSVEPKNFKQTMTKPSWIDAMQKDTDMSFTAYADADHAGVRTQDVVHQEALSS
nr:integrase, catalytic region, zinc finger, CCHC-type, peptidase aspartic, catalytic [Tanacetum cinerariifolium]